MADRHGGHSLGWLGTGRMGISLIHRLLGAGCDVTVYNRTRAKAEPLVSAGAKVTDTAAGLASADIVFVTVGTSQDLVDALTGPAGLTSGGRAPSIVVDCSTVSAEASEEVRAKLAAAGCEFLAAPVTIIIGAAAVIVTVSIYYVSARVNKAQAEMQRGAVDAAAYERAKTIYEGAIQTLQGEIDTLRTEMSRLRVANETMSAEISKARALNQNMQDEVDRLKRNNANLTVQVDRLRAQLNIIENNNSSDEPHKK